MMALPFAAAAALSLLVATGPSGDEKPGSIAPAPPPGATPITVTHADLDRLAERESALAAILSFIERGEEVPLYQVLLLSEEMAEERAIEAAVAASIEKADSIRRGAEERARARLSAAWSETESIPPPHPPPGGEPHAMAATEPVGAPSEGARPSPPPRVATERLVALGGLAAADVLLDTGRALEALALYDAILSRPGEATPYARFRRARCLEALLRLDEAHAAFDEIARAAAPSPIAAQAAFAARHIAWKRLHEASISAVSATSGSAR